MNTATRTHRAGPALALLLGSVLAIIPATAHADTAPTSTDAGAGVRFVPSDDDPRGRHVVRQAASSDADSAPLAPRPNLRQLLESDRVVEPAEKQPVPAPRGNLRQAMEADRPVAPTPDIRPNLRQLMEADRMGVMPRLGMIRP